MILDSTRTLSAILAVAVDTTAPRCIVDYADIAATTFVPDVQAATLSDSGGTILSAPAASTKRQVKYINIFNGDVIAHTVTVTLETGSTLVSRIVMPGETLSWSVETGWYIQYQPIVRQGGTDTEIISTGTRVKGGSVTFPTPFLTVPNIQATIINGDAAADAERPLSVVVYNPAVSGFSYIVDAYATVASDRTITTQWLAQVI